MFLKYESLFKKYSSFEGIYLKSGAAFSEVVILGDVRFSPIREVFERIRRVRLFGFGEEDYSQPLQVGKIENIDYFDSR